MLALETKELGRIFNSLHDTYQVMVEQGGCTLPVIGFRTDVDDDLTFIIEVQGVPLDDRDLEIIDLKKQNKCLIEQLRRVKIDLERVQEVTGVKIE